MSNFLEDIAFRQYENQLPEKYNSEPVFCCDECGCEIYPAEQFLDLNGHYCMKCMWNNTKFAEREELEYD